jgi:hypothetical protein
MVGLAFISALWNGTLHINAFVRDEAHVRLIWIGYDMVHPLNYHLMVELYPTEQGTEYAFAMVTEDRMTGHCHPEFDSSKTNALIPKSYRPKIREVLFSQTEQIVRATNFPSFFMTTFCDNLPADALEKYERLCEIFRRCGYSVTYTEPEPGKHFWFMNQGAG